MGRSHGGFQGSSWSGCSLLGDNHCLLPPAFPRVEAKTRAHQSHQFQHSSGGAVPGLGTGQEPGGGCWVLPQPSGSCEPGRSLDSSPLLWWCVVRALPVLSWGAGSAFAHAEGLLPAPRPGSSLVMPWVCPEDVCGVRVPVERPRCALLLCLCWARQEEFAHFYLVPGAGFAGLFPGRRQLVPLP